MSIITRRKELMNWDAVAGDIILGGLLFLCALLLCVPIYVAWNVLDVPMHPQHLILIIVTFPMGMIFGCICMSIIKERLETGPITGG
jgi:hypothetical protein